jgi:hypothetical protein
MAFLRSTELKGRGLPFGAAGSAVRAMGLLLPFLAFNFVNPPDVNSSNDLTHMLIQVLPIYVPGFLVIDLLVTYFSSRRPRLIPGRALFDLLALGLVSGGLIFSDLLPIPLILLTLMVVIGAAFFDLGLALGIWLTVSLVVIPHVLYPDHFFGFSIGSPSLGILSPSVLALVAAFSTLPLFIYIRTIRRLKKSVANSLATPFYRTAMSRLAMAGLLIGLVALASYLSAWTVVREVDGIVTVNSSLEKSRSSSVLGLELEGRFGSEELAADNKEFREFLLRQAALINQNLYVFENTADNNTPVDPLTGYRLILGARQDWDSESGPRVIPVYHLKALSSAERRALFSLWDRDPYASGNSFPRPPAAQSLYSTDQSLVGPAGMGSDGAYWLSRSGQFNEKARFILVNTPTEINWWKSEPFDAMVAIQYVFPWLFYLTVFGAGTFLLAWAGPAIPTAAAGRRT